MKKTNCMLVHKLPQCKENDTFWWVGGLKMVKTQVGVYY